MGVECNGGVGGRTLVVRWSAPPIHAHNGNLKAYRLTLTRIDDTTGDVFNRIATYLPLEANICS